jgi:hypothetical protein
MIRGKFLRTELMAAGTWRWEGKRERRKCGNE